MSDPEPDLTVLKRKQHDGLDTDESTESIEDLTNFFDELVVEYTTIVRSDALEKQTKFPGLVTGHLPVEVQLKIWSYLSAGAVANVALSSPGAHSVLWQNATRVSNTIIKRDMIDLFQALKRFDFRGQHILTCWRRYSETFGSLRHPEWFPDVDRFLDAYLNSNRRLRPLRIELEVILNICFALNDYLQWDVCFTQFTPLARYVEFNGWETALRIACGISGELLPGALGPLISLWQKDVRPLCSAHWVAGTFVDIRESPLQSLVNLPRNIVWWQANLHFYSMSARIGNDVTELPECLRVKLDARDLPRTYNGFRVYVGTKSERGKALIKFAREMDDPTDMLLAGLVQELRVWWL